KVPLAIVAVLEAESQFTWHKNAVLTKRRGTMVVPSIIKGGFFRNCTSPFTSVSLLLTPSITWCCCVLAAAGSEKDTINARSNTITLFFIILSLLCKSIFYLYYRSIVAFL